MLWLGMLWRGWRGRRRRLFERDVVCFLGLRMRRDRLGRALVADSETDTGNMLTLRSLSRNLYRSCLACRYRAP